MTGDRKRTANAMNPALDPCVFLGFQGVAADAACNLHRGMHFVFGRPVLPRAAVGCNCAKMRDTRSLSRRTRPPVSDRTRGVSSEGSARRKRRQHGDMSRRVRQQMPSGLAAHMAPFFLYVGRHTAAYF